MTYEVCNEPDSHVAAVDENFTRLQPTDVLDPEAHETAVVTASFRSGLLLLVVHFEHKRQVVYQISQPVHRVRLATDLQSHTLVPGQVSTLSKRQCLCWR